MTRAESLRSLVVIGFLALAACQSPRHTYYQAEVRYASPAPPPSVVVVPHPAPVAVEGGEVDVAVFYGALSPHGRWIVLADHGRVWIPYEVSVGWRPYTVGHWVYSDYGWMWVSEEPWGWATYHYGRWTVVPHYGWVWVPGAVWGPAWVAWRSGGGYMGWAPLPPTRGLSVSLTVTDSEVTGIAAGWFTFVEERSICEPRLHAHVVPVERNVTIINKTTNITRIEVVNKKVVNRSVSVEHVERVTGRKVERVNVKEAGSVADAKEVRGKEVAVYRPRPVARPTGDRPAPRPPTVRPTDTDRDVKPPAAGDRRARQPDPNYEKERKRIDDSFARDIRDMDQRHARERNNRPANVTAAQLARRHDGERREVEDRRQREMDALHRRYPKADEHD